MYLKIRYIFYLKTDRTPQPQPPLACTKAPSILPVVLFLWGVVAGFMMERGVVLTIEALGLSLGLTDVVVFVSLCACEAACLSLWWFLVHYVMMFFVR